jgi:capsule polysaccharide export protein KpsE/RkpR
MDKARAIIDYAAQDNATAMRDTMYSAIQDRVMAHIEAKKQEVALNLISNPDNPKEAQVDDEAITH